MAAVLTILAMFKFSATKRISPSGLEISEFKHAGRKFTVASVDLHVAALDLYWKRSDGSAFADFPALRTYLNHSGRRLLFATNAGIFDPSYAPCGLHVEASRELAPLNLNSGEGNFYMQPNGVFLIDDQCARIVESQKYPGTTAGIRLATQSGPLLLIHGQINPQFRPDSNNRRVRSGVGVLSGDRVFLVISCEPVTFYEFATLFRDELKCSDALYLDGVISRFYAENEKPAEGESHFAGILAVTNRE